MKKYLCFAILFLSSQLFANNKCLQAGNCLPENLEISIDAISGKVSASDNLQLSKLIEKMILQSLTGKSIEIIGEEFSSAWFCLESANSPAYSEIRKRLNEFSNLLDQKNLYLKIKHVDFCKNTY